MSKLFWLPDEKKKKKKKKKKSNKKKKKKKKRDGSAPLGSILSFFSFECSGIFI